VHGTQADGTAIDQTHILGHDGHGSVRVLYNLAETVANAAQVLTFSAYGQMLAVHAVVGGAVATQAASLTSLGYSGEHFDAQAAQQYLRARYYDPATGTFNRLDPFSGNMHDPQSLHKYLYVHGDPVQGVDPLGLFAGLVGLAVSVAIGGGVDAEYSREVTNAGGDVIAALDPDSSFSRNWARYRSVQGIVMMVALGGAGVIGMVHIARKSPRLAKMLHTLLPGFVDRVTNFLRKAHLIFDADDFAKLSSAEQRMVRKAHAKRIEIGHEAGSNVASALVRKKNPTTGQWEDIPEPYVARNGMLHSEAELHRMIHADLEGAEYEITHIFTERTPCLREGCSINLATLSEQQTTPIKLIDFDIPEGFGSVSEVLERWNLLAHLL
jgi:RHS repeat-associated protein